MSARPLLGLALALALGALLGGPAGRPAALALIGLSGALLVLAPRAPTSRFAAAGVLGAALGVGAAAAGVERLGYDAAPLRLWAENGGSDDPVLLHGTAAADPREVGRRLVVVVDVASAEVAGSERPLPGRAKLEVWGEAPRPVLLQGDRLSVWATVRAPRGFGNPGAFDTVGQARRDGVHALASCKTPQLLTVHGPGDVPWPVRAASRLRGWARGELRRFVPAGAEEGLVRAMVLGDRTGVDEETAEAFRAAGTYHVLAISGAQVALVAGFLWGALRRVGIARVPTALVTSAALALYAELVGGDPPVTRAATMAIVLLVGRCLDLDADLANLLGLAAALLIVYRPSSAGDLGFQLSFVATLGILLLTPPLLRRFPTLPLRVDLALCASLAAQAALLPLLVASFHRVAPAALLLNLVAVPLSAAVLVGGAAVLAAAALARVAAPVLGEVAWIAAHALLRSGDLLGLAAALDFRVPSPSAGLVVLYVAGLVALLAGRRAGLAVTVLAGLGLVWPPAPGGDGRLHLTALDVGQGDALVVRSPHGRVWLVDAGGSYDGGFDVGEAVVAPYLWSQGVRGIEGLLVTHAHPDHAGGVPALLRGFAVGEVWEGLAPRQDAGYAALDRELGAARVSRRSVVRGVTADWDGVTAEVLWPPVPGRAPWRVRNDDSVVLSLRFGEVVLVLAGDVEAAAEQGLGIVHADVLKVPHHGSRTSSSPGLVSGVAGGVAVVSVGFRNRFGHPHRPVLERYRRAGCRVYRTDDDGAVTVSTDGQRLWVATHRWGVTERVR
jgi:competence protein ComEC